MAPQKASNNSVARADITNTQIDVEEGISSRYNFRRRKEVAKEPPKLEKTKAAAPSLPPPLPPPLLQPHRPCIICAESKPISSFPFVDPYEGHFQTPLDPAQHRCGYSGLSTYCSDCLFRHTETVISSTGKWTNIHCVACGITLTKKHILNGVSAQHGKDLTELVKRRTRETHPSWRWCLKAGCGAGQKHDMSKVAKKRKRDAEELGNLKEVVICTTCGAKSCFNCQIPWHEGQTCDEYEKGSPEAKRRRVNEREAKKISKKCPGKNCPWYAEKNGGCNMVVCAGCGKTWDWQAQKFDDLPPEPTKYDLRRTKSTPTPGNS
ncbi:MAG: hypothetical protein M1834_004007 [Cirrosporium novae-zelandiae]|nr:MAG: hypothetical protein M1834_004007 [Cirrosporium novae-zelandiae]